MSLLEIFTGGRGSHGITELNEGFASRLERMVAALPEQYKGQVKIMSGYRSVAEQQVLWDKKVREIGEARARKLVAPPGKSNHQRGVAADLTYATPAVQRWVHQNAARFGLAFPMGHEPWHIEPLGLRGGKAPSFSAQGITPEPEAYTDDDHATHQAPDNSLETQLLRIADLVNTSRYAEAAGSGSAAKLANRNVYGSEDQPT